MSHDPIDAAFKALHQGNLLAAKDARIKSLEDNLDLARKTNNEQFWAEACKRAEARAENQAQTIAALRYGGNELARVMEDILGSGQITCAISRAVMTATIARWKNAKTGQ